MKNLIDFIADHEKHRPKRGMSALPAAMVRQRSAQPVRSLPHGAARASITFNLPAPPSTNKLYNGMGANRRRAVGYTTWSNASGREILAQRAKLAVRELPKGWFIARIRLPIDDPADSDNRLKALFDLLRKIHVTPDDRWRYGAAFGRSPLVPKGRIIVTVRSTASRGSV